MSKRFFVKRYKKLFPDFEIEECSLKDSIRINTLKIDEKEIKKRLKKEGVSLEKIPFLRYGYWYKAEFSLGSTPEYLLGYYYLQETSSQLPVEVLNPKENEIILDMASAPGSKTTQIAQYTNDKAAIVALDNTKWRLNALRNNLERLGIRSVLVYNKDARFVSDFKQEYDKILLDAPCTGNFLIDKDWFEKRSMEDVKIQARLQKELLRSALTVLKKTGTLVYSTCSLEPEENELVIDWLLAENDDIYLEKVKISSGTEAFTEIFDEKINPEISKCRRIVPNKDYMQPFFIAKIRKK
ncbi:MAG: NOL1/NOP2/sun family putative RNA methylase [Candidatus Woesearchaeota archaeon]